MFLIVFRQSKSSIMIAQIHVFEFSSVTSTYISFRVSWIIWSVGKVEYSSLAKRFIFLVFFFIAVLARSRSMTSDSLIHNQNLSSWNDIQWIFKISLKIISTFCMLTLFKFDILLNFILSSYCLLRLVNVLCHSIMKVSVKYMNVNKSD